jgi:epsilon-lactone hydrolase
MTVLDEIAQVRALLAGLGRDAPFTLETLATTRAGYDKSAGALEPVAGVEIDAVTIGGVPCRVARPLQGSDESRAVLYFHGGGYCLGSAKSHGHLGAMIAKGAGCPVVLPDYRLAPEHPCPAGIEDGVAVWRALLAEGLDPARLVMGGDSAGGGLTFALALALRDGGLALPGGLFAISPWVNLSNTGDSYTAKAARDPILKKGDLDLMAGLYAGGLSIRDGRVSPLFADLSGLPPVLIQVGEEELLVSDATRLAERAGLAGTEISLHIWPDMIHVWHWFWPLLTEARTAIAHLTGFIRTQQSG